jgi:hypothetical protein
MFCPPPLSTPIEPYTQKSFQLAPVDHVAAQAQVYGQLFQSSDEEMELDQDPFTMFPPIAHPLHDDFASAEEQRTSLPRYQLEDSDEDDDHDPFSAYPPPAYRHDSPQSADEADTSSSGDSCQSSALISSSSKKEKNSM